MLGQLRVQRPGRGEVMPERLLHHDAAVGRGDPRLRQPVRDGREELRRHRQVEGADVLRFLVELLCELRPAPLAAGVDRHVVEGVEELLHQRRRQQLRLDELGQRLRGRLAELRPAHLRARRADHPRAGGDLVRREAPEQARQDLAVGEIPGRAEDHQIERRHGDDGGDHAVSPSVGQLGGARKVGAASRAGDRRGPRGIVDKRRQPLGIQAGQRCLGSLADRAGAAPAAPPGRCRRLRPCR